MPRPPRLRPAPLRATVVRCTRRTPHLVRITLGGEELTRLSWPGPAAHLKLMLPAPGARDVVLPRPDGDGMVDYAAGPPITMRTYTLTRYRPGPPELDLDIVLHGPGPATRWASAARPGDRVAVTVPRGAGFTADPSAQWTVLGGDASALPALTSIAAVTATPVAVYVELDDPADRLALPIPVTWLRTGSLEEAVLAHPRAPGRGQYWVAGEAAAVRRIRAGLLLHLPADQIATRGYWRLGAADHPDHDHGTGNPTLL